MPRIPSVLTIAALACFLAAGCGQDREAEMAAARQAELTALAENQAALNAKRQELSDLQAQLAELAESEEATEEEIAALEAQVTATEVQVFDLTDDFGTKVVEFINADPPLVGEPLSESQLAAIRMKSDEDIVLAREHIEKGGDYRRAIDIYVTALKADPDNEKLLAAKEEAEANRFMSEERFAQVRKGMTEKDVREVLGPVNLRNIRPYPERKVTAWFYPTAEDGSAAAVWFRKGKNEQLMVYDAKFEAVEGQG